MKCLTSWAEPEGSRAYFRICLAGASITAIFHVVGALPVA